MICPTCDRETAAVSELGEMGGGRMRKRCAHPDCKAALPEEKPPVQVAKPVEFWDASQGGTTARRLAAVGTGDPPYKQAPANDAPPSLAQTLAAFEARLPYVRDRIAELRAFESEERQIVLILTAAGRAAAPENKPS